MALAAMNGIDVDGFLNGHGVICTGYKPVTHKNRRRANCCLNGFGGLLVHRATEKTRVAGARRSETLAARMQWSLGRVWVVFARCD